MFRGRILHRLLSFRGGICSHHSAKACHGDIGELHPLGTTYPRGSCLQTACNVSPGREMTILDLLMQTPPWRFKSPQATAAVAPAETKEFEPTAQGWLPLPTSGEAPASREKLRGGKIKKNLKTQGRAQPSDCLSHGGIHHGDLLHRYTRDMPSPYFRHCWAAALPLLAHKTNRVATAAQSQWRNIVWDQTSGGKHPWTCRETCFLLGLEN